MHPQPSPASRLLSIALTIALALTMALPAAAQPQEGHAIDVARSTVTVRVFKSGLFRGFADDHVIQAPLAEGSVDDSATPRVDVAVDARQMRVLDPRLSPKDRASVQARMLGPEVLDAGRFTQIRFQSISVQQLEANRWVVRGHLALHGQIHPVAVKVARENGHYTGSTTVRQTEYGMTPISVAAGTVKVKDEVAIEFDIVTAN